MVENTNGDLILRSSAPGAVRAQPDHVDPVVSPPEASPGCDRAEFIVESTLQLLAQPDIEHDATRSAHEMVVMAAGDVLGQLEVGVIVAGDDPVDDVGVFQYGQVAVGRALGQARRVRQEFHDRLRIRGVGQCVDDLASTPGVALPLGPQPLERRIVDS